MKAGRLKELIKDVDDDFEVGICVETPGGYVCPDGCVVPLEIVSEGMDWHSFELLLIPKYRLKLTDGGLKDWTERK